MQFLARLGLIGLWHNGDDVEDVQAAFGGVGFASLGCGAHCDQLLLFVRHFGDFERGAFEGGYDFVWWEGECAYDCFGGQGEEVDVALVCLWSEGEI